MVFWDRWRKKQPSFPAQWEKGGKTADKKEDGIKAEEDVLKKEREKEVLIIDKDGKDEKDAHLFKQSSEKKEKKKMSNAYRIILRPLVSEKSTKIGQQNQYVFVVDRAANKVAVKQALEAMYAVDVVSVNMMRVHGKSVRFGRTTGKRAPWKKAVVTIKVGQHLDLYEGV